MKLVIEIPERTYEQIKFYAEMGIGTTVDEIVLNGTPLPKGHGNLKDVDALYESSRLCHTEEDGTACVEWREINDAPTIIEADGGEKDDKS